MTDPAQALTKARLIELTQKFKEKDSGKKLDVQFNPETLKVSYSNQISQDKGGDQASGNPGLQFTGTGLTKLSLQLWFDVTASGPEAGDDVRRLTQNVVYFMTPQPSEDDPKKLMPPGVRFVWGSFLFDGVIEGMDESIEFFSPDGKPLRASVGITMLQQKILEVAFVAGGAAPARPGQAPLNAARAGDSLQAMAARLGKGDWQSIAAANGIEDPLRMAAGRLVNLNPTVPIAISIGASARAPVQADLSVFVSTPSGLNASLGGSIGGSFGIN